MNVRHTHLLSIFALTLSACAQPAVTVDDTVTGLEVSFSYDAALGLDQVEVKGWTGDRTAAFEPFLLPDEPAPLTGTEQSFALLLAEELDGQTLRLEIVGISSGEPVAAGQGSVMVVLGALAPISITLSPDEVCDLDQDHDGICDTEDPCIDLDNDGLGLAGTDLSGCLQPIADSNDEDPTLCADSDGDGCDDCSEGGFDPNGDGPDGDGDGICDLGDACTDLDGDGFGTGTLNNAECDYELVDVDDSMATRCADTDEDSCDDCSAGSFDPSEDGSDLDSDGICDQGDTCTDIDDDGLGTSTLDTSGCVTPIGDNNDYDATLCADTDEDGCDDCVQGYYSPEEDGEDSDGDGICNRSDACTDVDGDGLGDGTLNNEDCVVATIDTAPEDPYHCADTDVDSCDDCFTGVYNTSADGDDADADGICDATDLCTDLDRDGLGTGTGGNVGCLTLVSDSDDNNAFTCADLDNDNCDDCSVGSWNPEDDGLDEDSDGLCNAGDTCTDVDGDGIGNGGLGNTGCIQLGNDSNDAVATSCLDTDSDGCDDCTSGSYAPMSDGSDLDSDGICDYTDRCIDFDGDGFGNGALGNETCPESLTDVDDSSASRCADIDEDMCDDCTNGSFNTSSDGADGDNDGICDLSDRCTDLDGDGLGNGNLGNTECVTTYTDTNDSATGQCHDSDGDGCDDCSQTNTWNPSQDGTDTDSDGMCDLGDSCTDYDNDGFGTGTLNNSGCVHPQTDTNDFLTTACADTDSDQCDDCSSGEFAVNNDGPDDDYDGLCNIGDTCTDQDGDGIGTGTQANSGCVYPLTDSNDQNAHECGDTDFDTCDDCHEGYFMPEQDGVDLDFDGLCDAGDPCVDVDQDGICSTDDCDDENPYCDVDCNDRDSDGVCTNWDCNDVVWSCTTDCDTNSDANDEAIAMSDCMEVFCGSDPYNGDSSCVMPQSSDELAEAINSLNGGTTTIVVGNIQVDENLPNIDDDGTVTITQEPGTSIITSADTLFRLDGDGHRLEGLVIEVEEGSTVIDVNGDDNVVSGITMITTDEQPREAIDVSGENNLIENNYIAGFDDRGIVIDGNGADNNQVLNNVVTGGADYTSNDKAGIFIRNADDTLIVGNVVAQNNMDGIALQSAQRTMIAHNTLANNANGLVFAGWGSNRRSSNTCARNNLITHHGWGAGIVSRSGTTWDTSSDCASTSGYGNSTYGNGISCDMTTCYSCNCLPADTWWQYEHEPNYLTTERGETGYYCLGNSEFEDLGRDLGYDLNGDQSGHFNGSGPDIGGREVGSAQCQ